MIALAATAPRDAAPDPVDPPRSLSAAVEDLERILLRHSAGISLAAGNALWDFARALGAMEVDARAVHARRLRGTSLSEEG